MADRQQHPVHKARTGGFIAGALLGIATMFPIATLLVYHILARQYKATVPIEHVIAMGHADMIIDADGNKTIKWKKSPDILENEHSLALLKKDKDIQDLRDLLVRSADVIAELEKQAAIRFDLDSIPEGIGGTLVPAIGVEPEEEEKVGWFSKLFKKKTKTTEAE